MAACAGGSVPVLDVSRDLPWLGQESRQARDIERFRWFSEDYLALDPKRPNSVIDMRYSVVPNQIDALWGIELDRRGVVLMPMSRSLPRAQVVSSNATSTGAC